MRTLVIGTVLVVGGGCAPTTASARDAALLARLDAIDAREHAVEKKLERFATAMVLLGMKAGYAGLLLVYADGTTRSYDVHVDAEPRDAAGARIDLVVGGLRVVPSAGVTNFATNNDVVRIKSLDDGQKLVLDAVKPGYTGLTLIYADGRVDNYDVHVAPCAR